MENTGNEIFNKIGEILSQKGRNIVIVPHENPDGDAIGSAVGLAEILNNSGHNVNVISPNDYPVFLKWFTSEIEVVIFEREKKKARKYIGKADILICIDFNDSKRAAKLEDDILNFSGPKLLIDHHPNPEYFCDYTVSEPVYSSTAELIYDFINRIGLGEFLNQNAAEALFTGILTDTGSFSHNTSRPNMFSIVSELMKFGINTDKIQSHIYHNFSSDRMKLLGYCLNEKMEVFPELRSAIISITKAELEKFNFKPGDTEGFVNYPLSINNIVFSALFIEKEGYVKASFRSKGNFPANDFSKNHFNGGGHMNAAGGECYEDFTKTIELFKQLLPKYKHQLLETKI